MYRKAILLLLCFFLWAEPICASNSFKLEDIQKIMERIFTYHIENKKLTPTIVRRSMKIYTEQFDPDKAYLLESEILPYLHLSDAKAQEILSRLQKNDYSDFFQLNQIMQKAIIRAQNNRDQLGTELAQNPAELESFVHTTPAKFATSTQDLMGRQKNRMIRFYLFHNSRTRLDSIERKKKVFALYDKKIRRLESNYLFLTAEMAPLAQAKIEYLLSLRILKSFAKSLDTHTSFFSSEEAADMRMSLEKQFEGVGVVLSEGIDGVIIAELIKGSPAAHSGKIAVNDLLVEIDGTPTGNIAFEDVLELLKNRDKGDIILGFKRLDLESHNENFFRVSLRKRPIVMNEERIETSFEKFGEGILGKIVLYSFYESADGVSSERDIKEAIRSFREKGPLIGLVLDLRENSGGFLSQAVKVAGLFVSNGVIVISKYGKEDVHYLRNIVGKSVFNGPLVILTSQMSASASEIVAQALQDYGVALVVGDIRTFGKGSIQYQTVTDEKADLFFKVTVGRYYTVSGKSTQIDGVIADIVVPTQYAPYNIGEKYLEYPLPPDRVDSAYVDSLSDLDEKTRYLFQKKYLPYLQRPVSFWKKQLPELKKNSAYRLAHNPNFQAFIKRQEKIRARLADFPVNTVDEHIKVGMEDLQMTESIDIIKDMIFMEAESRPTAELLHTGSD
ncbi:MAG: S41 family peptidase [Chlamydiota bacterium]